jgi:hypothetical protein
MKRQSWDGACLREPRHTAKLSKATSIDPTIYTGLAEFRLALRRFLAFSELTTGAAGVTGLVRLSRQDPRAQLSEHHNGFCRADIPRPMGRGSS